MTYNLDLILVWKSIEGGYIGGRKGYPPVYKIKVEPSGETSCYVMTCPGHDEIFTTPSFIDLDEAQQLCQDHAREGEYLKKERFGKPYWETA